MFAAESNLLHLKETEKRFNELSAQIQADSLSFGIGREGNSIALWRGEDLVRFNTAKEKGLAGVGMNVWDRDCWESFLTWSFWKLTALWNFCQGSWAPKPHVSSANGRVSTAASGSTTALGQEFGGQASSVFPCLEKNSLGILVLSLWTVGAPCEVCCSFGSFPIDFSRWRSFKLVLPLA